MFIGYATIIFVYSTILQLLSIIFKHRLASNFVIPLKEDPSPISVRKELENGSNSTSHENKEEGERNNRDETLGKFDIT